MQIQSASTYSALSPRQLPASASAATAGSATATATSADRATISQAARDLLAAQSSPVGSPENTATAVFDTDQGAMALNIDNYFSPPATAGGGEFSLPPLLLPNQRNIDALSRHISATIPQFLAQNDIPYAPSSITYDAEGKIQLPADYPYAMEFKQALKENPTLARELSTVSALTSHRVEMKKSLPFQKEYAAAAPNETAAVVAKYSYLFSGTHQYDIIALQFSPGGSLSLSADGKPLS